MERAWYVELIEALNEEFHRLIFIDESAINTDLILRYGRAPKGERVQGQIPRNTPPAHSIIGALAPEGIIAAMELEGAIDGAAFAVFARECLVPELRRGDVVILDNNATHFHEEALSAIEAAGAWVMYLPAYSPDLNPIEHCWAKVKHLLRSAAARTAEALHRAFRDAIRQITPENAKAWFSHCGYQVTPA